MFESIINFFKNLGKKEQETVKSKDAAKERLHLVLMQDRANVSADFLDLMKQEIIEVIKKYIDVDENSIDVRLTNKTNGDGTSGAPALYANIPIVSIKEDIKNKIARENDEKAEHIIPDNNYAKEKVEEKHEEQNNVENKPVEQQEKTDDVEESKPVEQQGERNNVEENKATEPTATENNKLEETRLENKSEEQTNSTEFSQNIQENRN